MIDAGVWDRAQVVPATWIESATTPRVELDVCNYGYQWWLCASEEGDRILEGSGNGGQELLVLPELDLVLVVNAGLYNEPEPWKPAWNVLEKVVIPALQR